jgi:flagellar L-ring protein precursor FlgH
MKENLLPRKIESRVTLWLILAGGLSMIVGCAGSLTSGSLPATAESRPLAPAIEHVQTTPSRNSVPDPRDGSLWVEDGPLSQMFVNAKARNIGDIITIKIVETATATNQASTKTGRNSTLSAGLDNFFNLEERYPSTSPFFNPFSGVKGGFDSSFDGSGSTARSNNLNAYMTARITDILPNGNLSIEGNREVRVNHENQVITLTGLVRPRDISADNVVQSTYLADARITYSGTGVINDNQQPGWLTRIVGKIWPF